VNSRDLEYLIDEYGTLYLRRNRIFATRQRRTSPLRANPAEAGLLSVQNPEFGSSSKADIRILFRSLIKSFQIIKAFFRHSVP
jgi:hypothetical protein